MSELRLKSTGTIKLFENDNTSNVTIASPASLGADRTVTLPDADVTLVSGTMSTVALTGSTNNTIPTVTGANAISGEANLTFDGTDLTVGTGNVIMGTSGKGIDFSATPDGSGTMASEVLDDYEEGSWTPGFATGTPTYTTMYNRMGRYTKIGNVCSVHMELYAGTISFADATATLTIEGLPFAAGSTGATFGVAMASHVQVQNMYSDGVTYNTLAATNADILNCQPRLSASATTFTYAFSPGDNSAIGEFKNAAFHGGSGLVIGLSYRTA